MPHQPLQVPHLILVKYHLEMTTINFAYTVPFPKDTKITQEQAFEALRIKCREPMKFVPVIVACEVLDETPTTMKRKATIKTGEVMVEDMELYKPSLVRVMQK